MVLEIEWLFDRAIRGQTASRLERSLLGGKSDRWGWRLHL